PVIKQKLLEILKSHPNIDQNKTLAVLIASGGTNISGKLEVSFGSCCINIQIYAMVNKVFFSDFINVQDEIFINIAKELNDLDIEFEINPVTLHKY
ncbi:mechanosensitive ion channel protein MscS, partial [Francisella tularensis subsp. holarctica]|nr:mechanosensitive ion channel protein MscS [Francisella tularensis subsp. holarctica]